MNILNITPLTDDDAENPLFNVKFDDLDGIEELGKYTQYEQVEAIIDSFSSGPSSMLRSVYKPQMLDFNGEEKEFWINLIIQEADFYLKEIRKWILTGKRTRNLIRSLEDLHQYNEIPETAVFLLKGKARHINRAPLLRLYLLQIGAENDDPEWILLFEGIKFEYDIKDCPGTVSSVYKRTKLVIDWLNSNG